MIWWFLILGVSALIVAFVAVAIYLRLRRHLLAAHPRQDVDSSNPAQQIRPARQAPSENGEL